MKLPAYGVGVAGKKKKNQNPQLTRNTQNDIKVVKTRLLTDQVKGAIKFCG